MINFNFMNEFKIWHWNKIHQCVNDVGEQVKYHVYWFKKGYIWIHHKRTVGDSFNTRLLDTLANQLFTLRHETLLTLCKRHLKCASLKYCFVILLISLEFIFRGPIKNKSLLHDNEYWLYFRERLSWTTFGGHDTEIRYIQRIAMYHWYCYTS